MEIDYGTAYLTDTLSGIPIVDEAIGAYSVSVVDSVLCLSTTKKKFLFDLYSVDGDSLASVGLRGEGPSDFTSNRMNRQYFHTDSSFGIWIIDVNASKLKRLNISRSLADDKSVVDSIVVIKPMVKNAFIAGKTILQETIGEGTFELTVTAPNGQVLSHEPLYLLPVDMSKLFMTYEGSTALSPDGRNLVTAMSAINQINILDLKHNSRRSITYGGVADCNSIIDRDTNTPYRTYYSSLTLGAHLIYALYENQAYITPEGAEKQPCEIHVIDYDGQLRGIIPLDRFLYTIAYSERYNSVFGLDDNETVWKYDLSNISL